VVHSSQRCWLAVLVLTDVPIRNSLVIISTIGTVMALGYKVSYPLCVQGPLMEVVLTRMCPALLPALLEAVADYPRQGSQPHQHRLYCTHLHCLTLVLRRVGPRLWGGSPNHMSSSNILDDVHLARGSEGGTFGSPLPTLLLSGPEELGDTLTGAMTDAGCRVEGTGKVR
jgi:hypothetical protein